MPTSSQPPERYPLPQPAEGAAWDALQAITGARGKLPRPYAAALHSPEGARALDAFSRTLWQSGALPTELREAIYLLVARQSACAHQWRNHVGPAKAAGLGDADLQSIARGQPLPASSPLADSLEFVRQLCEEGRVSDGIWAAVRARHGAAGVAELPLFVSLAQAIAWLINVQNTDAQPDDEPWTA